MFNKCCFLKVFTLLCILLVSCKAPPSSVIKDSLDSGNQYFEKGRYDMAINSYSTVIATLQNSCNPNLATACYNRGLAYLMKRQYTKAIDDFNAVIVARPQDSKAFFNRGTAFTKQKCFDRAIEDFNMVIAKDPRETKAYYSLAMVYFMKSDYEKTTDILSRAILLNPNFAKAYNGRGQSYMKSGNIGKAIPDFQKACEMGENCGCIMLDLISKKEKQQP